MKSPILFITIFIAVLNVVGQRHLPRLPKHHLNDSYYNVIYFQNDSLGYDTGNAYLANGAIMLRDFEEEKCALFANDFHLELYNTCNYTQILDSANTRLSITVGCQIISSLDIVCFPQNTNFQELDSDYCYPECKELYYSFGNDSLITWAFKGAKDVKVYRLQVKDHKVQLGQFLGEPDDCGYFTIVIPTDRDSYYGFYLSDDFIYWVHFFGILNVKKKGN